MRHILYYHKYCGFFLAKGISEYCDENAHNSSHTREYFEIHDEEQWSSYKEIFWISWWGESSYNTLVVSCHCSKHGSQPPLSCSWYKVNKNFCSVYTTGTSSVQFLFEQGTTFSGAHLVTYCTLLSQPWCLDYPFQRWLWGYLNQQPASR